ncbi:hypothetical protein ES708_33858 [subsurface metagenome]
MKTIKGPGIFLAQFLRNNPPYNTIESLSEWVSGLGYKGIQVPTWDERTIDLKTASESKTYCDKYKGKLEKNGLELIELAAYLQGQVLAIHPAYENMFESFYPKGMGSKQRTEWATNQLKMVISASEKLGTKNISVLSGSYAWHTVYPWPQRPEGLIYEAFTELVKVWKPVLDFADEKGITIGYELHPGSDLFDGATYEIFSMPVLWH